MSAAMQSEIWAENGFTERAPRLGANSSRLRLPLARLLEEVMILQSERFPNVQRLAEACGVSRRTIYRDLAILEAAGLSLVYVSDRQGYELRGDCLLQPPQLDDREALALLIMSRIASVPEPFGSLLAGGKALSNILHALPQGLRDRVADMGELLPSAQPAAVIPSDRRAIYETIVTALLHRQRLWLQYREHAAAPVSTTLFALYRLVHLQRQWALVGHSSADRGVRLYWLSGIESARTTGEEYTIPPRFRLEKFLDELQARRPPGDQRTEVRLRFDARVAPLIRDVPGTSGQTLHAVSDESIELVMTVETVEQIVPWILGFGDQVEVIEPEELKDAVCERARRIVQRYGNRPA
jgi:predicted DNA-binding transcriptional regulator YafY